MSEESLSPQAESYPLRGGRRALTLHATGFRHTAPWLLGGEAFVGFDEITDVSLGRRGLVIGTRKNVVQLPRRIFLDRSAPERLSQAMIERIGHGPDGPLQLVRLADLEHLARRRTPIPATLGLMAVCILLSVLDRLVGPELQNAGYFGSTLFFAGEYWRLLTGNLLHAGLAHLVVNLIFIGVLGRLVERPLGSTRTVLVMVASALGAMGVGAAFGYEDALGASGIACGLAGALLWLELRVPDRLPAVWRVPRRLLVSALVLYGLISIFAPNVAGAAHFGGFAVGMAATWLLAPRAPVSAQLPAWLRAVAAGAVIAVAATGLVLAREVAGGPDVLARRAQRLLSLPAVSPVILNNTAWMIVTASAPTPEQIQLALQSAQRAVAQTERGDPNFLDTLAESQYLSGRSEDAVETIDEAIALAPGEDYFVEQRRRFTGERAYEDRPAPPAELPPAEAPQEPWLEEPAPRHPGLPPGHPPLDEDSGISV